MSYNYNPAFLIINREVVARLVALANSREHTVYRFIDPHEATKVRFKINNILTSLAINRPIMAWVRREIRTWVRYEEGTWCLYVGVPPEDVVVRGAKPKPITLPDEGSTMVEKAAQPTLTIEAVTRENVSEALLRLAEAKTNQRVKLVQITNPPNQKGVDYISEKLAPEFHRLPGDKPLRFERREQ